MKVDACRLKLRNVTDCRIHSTRQKDGVAAQVERISLSQQRAICERTVQRSATFKTNETGRTDEESLLDRREFHLQTEKHDYLSLTGRRGGLVQAALKVCTGASPATRCRKTHRLRIGCSAQSVASGTTRNVAMTNLYVTFVYD